METQEMVIWRPGDMYILDFILDGKTSVRKIPVDECLKNHPQHILISWENVLEKIRIIEEQTYIKPWKEVDEDRWDDMLSVLPPEKWGPIQGCQMFRMSEYETSNITKHFAKIGDRYFEACRKTSQSYKSMLEEINDQFYN